MDLSWRPPQIRRAVGAAVLAALMLAACGDSSDPVAAPTVSPDRTAAGGTGSTGDVTDAAQSAGFAEVFATATPLDGTVAFDGATLDGTDTVVWFWAPWCVICRGEAPEVAEVASRYEPQVRMVGVPGRGELDTMRAFVDETGTGSITHVADLDGHIWSAFGVYGQPAYAFIDDGGAVELFVGGMGGDALAERIDELIAT